ncbi:MAG: hypothetical protein ACFE85_17950 [Candidatus Hodarchaeota archaeon]
MNDLIWTSIRPTIEGIFDKIQGCLEHVNDETLERQTLVIEGYAKLVQEMLKYTE